MPLRNIQYRRLTLGFGVLCLLLVSRGSIGSASTALADEGAILKMKHAYPTRDEYPYLSGCCAVKTEELLLKRESRALPPNLARAREAWKKKLGKTSWVWLHHFCAGLNRIGRFERSLASGVGSRWNMTEKQRGTLLYALKEFEMIEPPFRKAKSPLYAETIKNHAKTLRLLGRTPEAMSKIKEGIAADPAKAALYLYLARILLEMGDKKQAKQVLELGYKRTKGSNRIGKMLSGLR
ncbi:MAG: tetratricopeptide repeat protein [Proteobacteria bacterium]|nr:tetratricopeptide repeat protein [Pseudomonadota bacterium]